MKKFIFKIIIVLLPIVVVNSIFGFLRYNNGDDTIPYKQNWYKQFISHGQIDKNIGWIVSDSQIFDMSREVRKHRMVRYKDKWGFQNISTIINPDILFIGDSFFDDPYLSYGQSLSLNIPQSMNISSMGCSGFQVFNELKIHGYFTTPPRFIIVEVVERNLDAWINLYEQIELMEMKTIPSYYGLDFLFGNNFRGANLANLSLANHDVPLNKQGIKRKINFDRDVYFYRNKIACYDSVIINKIIINMKLVSQYFNKFNCQVIYVVAPDKESIFPELFPNSNLPSIQKQFDSSQIAYIDMFKEIMASPKRQECYYDGDTHWNQNAYKILIAKIKLKISNNDQ